jgi:cyanate permease
MAIAALVVTNFGVGVWVTMYLTFTQEVAPESVSTAMGLLGGAGSMTGALAMAAVGAISQATSSFSIPMAAVTVAGIGAAFAGLAASKLRTGLDA